MRFLAFLEGMSGVRGFLVSSEDGDRLHASGTGADFTWTALRAAAVAREFGVAGAIAGLGSFSAASVRSVQKSRLLAQSGDTVAVVDLELSRATTDIEAQLQERSWASADERLSDAPISSSDHDTLPPRAPPQVATKIPVSHHESSTAQSPASAVAVATIPLPFQGMAAIARPAVPRPNTAAPPTAQRAALASPASSRPARPPLPGPRASAPGTVAALEPPADAQRAAPAQAPDDATLSKRDETPGGSSALLTGSLATFALPDLLEFLRVGQRTGTLVCASEAGLGAIHITRGRITGAASPGVPSMGDWLVQRGAISQEKLHEALRHHTQSGTKTQLGATLIAQKLISYETLQEALVFHVSAVLRKLITWETGAFTFDPTSAEGGGGEIDIDPQAVLLNIFKDLDDAQRA